MKKIIILLLSLATINHIRSMEDNISPSLNEFVNKRTGSGKTALHLLAEISRRGKTALHILAKISKKYVNNTEIAVVDSASAKIVIDVLFAGASLNRRDKSGKTPLDYAKLNKDKLPKVYEIMQACKDIEDNDEKSDEHHKALRVLGKYLPSASTSEKP